MLLLSILVCAACQESMGSLLQGFGSEDPGRRTQAAERLLARWNEWTAEDLEKLNQAASVPDIEVSGRAKEIVRRISLRKRLGAPLIEKFPDADRVLAGSDDEARLRFLVEASTTSRKNRWPDDTVRPLAVNSGIFSASAWARVQSAIRIGEHRALVPLLFPFLREGPAEQRLQAVECVQTLGTKEDCLELLPCLGDMDAKVRASAARGLGWRIRGPAAPRLKPLLKDASPVVQKSVLGAISQARLVDLEDDVVPFLSSEDPECRRLAAQGLGRLRASARAPAVAILLEDKDPPTRMLAAEALGEMRCKEYAPALLRLLKDPDAGVRQCALRGLGTMEARECVDEVAALLNDPVEDLRSDAAYQLGRWNARRHRKSLIPLLGSDTTRRAAMYVIEQLDAKEAAEALMAVAEDGEKRLREGFYTSDRGFALEAVGALGVTGMTPRIVALLQEKELRPSAIEALVRMGAVEHADLIMNSLIDQRCGSWAAQGLAMFAPKELVPQITQFAVHDRWTCESVMIALGGIGGEDARTAILERLKDPRDYLAVAILSLAQVGRPEDATILFPFLDGPDGSIAAIALGELSARGGPDRKAVVDQLRAAKTLGARIALLRLGCLTPVEQTAIFNELLKPQPLGIPNEPPVERLSFGPEGIALNRAMEAIHDPSDLRRFEQDMVLEGSLESLEDLRDLLQSRGFTLDVEPATRWGRLPKGIRTSLRRVCDWMLEWNSESQVVDDHGSCHERRVVLQGSTVKLLRLRRQAEYWKQRLEGR